MTEHNPDECCPRFQPEPWDGTTLTWEDRRFVKDRVTSLFHIPLNFGAAMRRCAAAIEKAGATSESMVILSDESSLWGADVYVEVTIEVPGMQMATISGTFLSRVFEGPYSNMRKWIGEMKTFVQESGETLDKLYFYYTTCPKCAKKYGKNYVVLLAQIQS